MANEKVPFEHLHHRPAAKQSESGDCGKELKRSRLFGECHLSDADARLDHARKYGPKNQRRWAAAITQRL